MIWICFMYVVLIVAWIPLLLSFFRSWRARKNPISLAICLTIFLAAFTNVYLVLSLFDKTPERVEVVVYGICNAAVVGYFHVARRCADKTFTSDRRN